MNQWQPIQTESQFLHKSVTKVSNLVSHFFGSSKFTKIFYTLLIYKHHLR